MVRVEGQGPGNDVEKLLVVVCDKKAQGGGLGKQVEEAAKKAGENPTVLVRSSPCPTSPPATVSKRIADLIAPKGKGRRAVVQNVDWRAMAAFRTFHARENASVEFGAWQRQGRPLSNLPALRSILDLEKRLARRASPPRRRCRPPARQSPSLRRRRDHPWSRTPLLSFSALREA